MACDLPFTMLAQECHVGMRGVERWGGEVLLLISHQHSSPPDIYFRSGGGGVRIGVEYNHLNSR